MSYCNTHDNVKIGGINYCAIRYSDDMQKIDYRYCTLTLTSLAVKAVVRAWNTGEREFDIDNVVPFKTGVYIITHHHFSRS